VEGLFNPKLYGVVRKIYDEIVSGFVASENVSSPEFLASFPRSFFGFEGESNRYDIIQVAFDAENREESEKAMAAYFSDTSGADSQFYFTEAVEDFLNYIVPRTIGVKSGVEAFERYYRQFDLSIYGQSALVTGQSVLRDIHDHTGGSMQLPPGFRLVWFTHPFPGEISNLYLRERNIPFFEIRTRARPFWRGRDLSSDNGHFVLQYSFSVPKNSKLLSHAYQKAYESTTQFLLAARLKTYSTAYSDYRGFRTIGHLSALHMVLTNYPDELVEDGESRNLEEPYSAAISRLLERLVSARPDKFTVIQQKLDDALRRHRKVLLNNQRATQMNDIDKLLDYFQVLEAVVPFEGSHNISLAAARLLTNPGDASSKPFEMFQFIKDMHTIRNEVVHGRIDRVLEGKKMPKLDINRFRHIIYSLVCLHIMNGSLRDASVRLALGEPVKLEREYFDEYSEWTKRKKLYELQNKSIVFW
jgi:hypothetical protein